MNKNSILGFVFIFLILVGYSIFTAPSKEEKIAIEQRKQEIADSLILVQQQRSINQKNDSIKTAQAAVNPVEKVSKQSQIGESNDSVTASVSNSKFGEFSAAAIGKDSFFVVENDVIRLTMSYKGGFISKAELKNYKTYDSLPLVLFDKTNSNFSFLLNDKQVQSKDLYFEPFVNGKPLTADNNSIVAKSKTQIAMRLYPNATDGSLDKTKYFELKYTIEPENYMIGLDLNLNGMSNTVSPGFNDILLYWSIVMNSQEKDAVQERKQTGVFYRMKGESVDELSIAKDDENKKLETTVDWVSLKQQFFSATLIAKSGFNKASISQSVDKNNLSKKYLKTMESEISIPLASSDVQTVPMSIYLGPNKYKILNQYDLDLEQQIPLGWGFFLLHWINRFAVIPVFDFLSTFGWNYGIIILVLTLLLKLVLFPIAYKTYVSSAKMRILKPEVEEINQKYPKKEDALKKQQATMALYKKAGANPLSGCIPMLLQMPILIAMFRFFPASIELRQQAFLWAEDLSSYDAIFSWTQQIPLLSSLYGNHVSLFTLLMTITTIFYTKLNNDMMGSSSQQLPGMKTMMYLMPIMFLGFFNNYASGLSYYYFLANVFTFTQMFLIRRFINEDKIHAKIQENKKKPVQKSAFQKKLEDMAKQKGVNLKR